MDGRQRTPRRCRSEKIRENAEQKPPFGLSNRGFFLLINTATSRTIRIGIMRMTIIISQTFF